MEDKLIPMISGAIVALLTIVAKDIMDARRNRRSQHRLAHDEIVAFEAFVRVLLGSRPLYKDDQIIRLFDQQFLALSSHCRAIFAVKLSIVFRDFVELMILRQSAISNAEFEKKVDLRFGVKIAESKDVS